MKGQNSRTRAEQRQQRQQRHQREDRRDQQAGSRLQAGLRVLGAEANNRVNSASTTVALLATIAGRRCGPRYAGR